MHRSLGVVVFCGSVLLGAAVPAAAGTAGLLADLDQVPGFGAGSSYGVRYPLLALGDRLVFNAYEPSTGQELWASDGTYVGTRLLRDVTPGGNSTSFQILGTARQAAILVHDTNFQGPWRFWRSDGTREGTFPLHDAEAAFDSCMFSEAPEGASVGNRLFFLASGTSGCGLWATDGTVAGTRLVELLDGRGRDIVSAGNRVFFSTEDGGLWTSNGDGAFRLKDFDSSFDRKGPRLLTPAGSRAVFLGQQAHTSDGEELWVSDGTAAGTRALTRFFEPSPFGSSPVLKVQGNTVYFVADDGTGFDLWQVEVTGGEPRRVTDFINRFPFGDSFSVDHLLRVGQRVIFWAREEGETSTRLWSSGGTPATTAPLAGCPGNCPGTGFSALTQIGNRAVFEALDGNRSRLWVTDGTGAGTRLLASTFLHFKPVPLLGRLWFIGDASGLGFGLWRTDGTPAGTVRVADLGPGALETDTGFSPVALGNRIFFLANLSTREPQLWVSDGSPEGTRAISSVRDNPSSFPRRFTPFASGVLFTANANDDNFDRLLWRTDGTAAGTYPLPVLGEPLRIEPSAGGPAFVLTGLDSSSGPFQIWRTDGTVAGTVRVQTAAFEPLEVLAPFRNGVVFGVRKPDGRIALWESDTAGTRALLDLPADVVDVRALKALGSRLYFVARRESFVVQLWVSDGTAAGTRPVIGNAEQSFDLQRTLPLAQAGGAVYAADQVRLWKTDGSSPAGAVPLLEVDSEGVPPTNLTELHGALYFMAGLPGSWEEIGLWRTDGTPAGTSLVKAVGFPNPSYRLTDQTLMVRLGDRLLFLGDDGVHGTELWSSDGTAAGTVLVRDIAPGAESSIPLVPLEPGLTVAGGKVYFPATDGVSGYELWESDGTAAGTRRVQDIAPGGPGSVPSGLTAAGNRLFFAADDGVHGEEPWILPLDGAGCVPSATALCLGGRFQVEADWRDFDGNRGRGQATALTPDTGYFWFFDAANVEVILKVLNGQGINGHHWVFYGALSSVEYMLTVTDTQTGAVRRYYNPPRTLGSVADTEAFGPNGAKLAGVVTDGPAPQRAEPLIQGWTAAVEAGSCAPSSTRLCLNDGRFAVEARWKAQGRTGTGRVVALPGGDTGYFWFFDPNNVEVVLKVLDGRPLNDRFWVFYGALSNVEYTLTVTYTVTGTVKTYTNPSGRLASVADTGAF